MSKSSLGLAALGVSSVLLLSACGGGGGSDSGASGSFDQGTTEVVNASEEQGGTLRYAISANIESTDPGNTYYGYVWNFSRYYARTLLTYSAEPGKTTETVPDMAAEMPKVSDDGKTYTVKLRDGITFEDGSEVTSEDIKYGIARSNYGDDALPNGPRYFKELLADSDDYEGVNANPSDPLAGFDGIETPDDTTLVFHLKKAFADFPYVLVQPQTAPVPADADKGQQYQEHVVSSGPYKFEGDWSPGNGLTLVRNEEWDPDSDPVRPALPDKITVEEGVDQNEIDQRLVNGELDVDLGGTGLGPAKKGEVLTDEEAKANADNPENGSLRYVAVNTVVEPLDNEACRQAVMYAADHNSLQRAWGGAAGGEIPNDVIPPAIAGHDPKLDLYPSEGDKGDVEKAKAKLEECGQEDGFSTNLGVRSDRPTEVAAAEALQASLDRVGIKVDIKQYPSDTFTNTQAGSPDFVHENELGLNIYGWIPDWPTGYGFLSYIAHGDNIKKAGNSNISELDDEEINEMLTDAVATEDASEQERLYQEVDRRIMETGAILPIVFEKSVLYRPESLTNVRFSAGYAMYDYMPLGTTNT
ncbi:ABC transporter substrate-binding protein [Nocardiopsis sp. RSe5-2]|uniref:ABC transporter substrate-binding protein n=1 Tax=Nocardiopsis endophytica TaxID=3018445 RepID=A0ABT4U2Y6_9ACTN|nr:ABC transporter substrate-binding protein [Nocardiopsis endophytica]MDA2811306.1 ABC transporter substrate-binding protein [Nocardiopsis endophytica]